MATIFTKINLALIAAGVLLYSSALAESFVKFGKGVSNSSHSDLISIGFRDKLFDVFVYQYEGGIWLDPSGGGRKTSAILGASLGIEVKSGDLVFRSVHGPSFISTPDAYIGGYFPNFNHDVYLGLRDKNDYSVGVSYKHVSNAGLMPPNLGRDFVSVDIGIPW